MYIPLRNLLACCCLLTAFHCAHADGRKEEDFLRASDRIEWDAGGLYDGRFDDGAPFQIQLAYRKPAAAPARASEIGNIYWYPRHFTGARIGLSASPAPAGTIGLQWTGDSAPVETFSISLAPDRLGGTGNWRSLKLGKSHSFTLQRRFLYRAIAVTRPAPPDAEDATRPFVFSALYPQLADPGVNAWMWKRIGDCTDDTECANSVLVDWSSPSLLSLNAMNYGYSSPTPHGHTASSMRHYRPRNGKMVAIGLDTFLDASPACRTKTSQAIIAGLRAQDMPWAENGALDSRYAPKFLALPDGLEFHFDQYEVGAYAQGMPSVFVPRAKLGNCVKELPRFD